jgi:hypothetical protein
MPVRVISNEIPRSAHKPLEKAVQEALDGANGEWVVSINSDRRNNAWDVEVRGPSGSHWERRFSGDDRDPEVIAEAIRASIVPERNGNGSHARDLNEALSNLAAQGIAFTSEPEEGSETRYTVDRVQLKESEILYLFRQRALTADGIRSYLLNRRVA